MSTGPRFELERCMNGKTEFLQKYLDNLVEIYDYEFEKAAGLCTRLVAGKSHLKNRDDLLESISYKKAIAAEIERTRDALKRSTN